MALELLSKITKNRPKKWKLLNQFYNFFYLRMSFDWKMQDIFEISNQNEHVKCGKNFIRSRFRDRKL